jgi:hypothetical protein
VTVRLKDAATIELAGACPIEDAEPLLQLLLANPQAAVDWRTCDQAHSAVVQILLISKAHLRGPPRGAFLADFIAAQIDHSAG